MPRIEGEAARQLLVHELYMMLTLTVRHGSKLGIRVPHHGCRADFSNWKPTN